jgi:hypothetical protein
MDARTTIDRVCEAEKTRTQVRQQLNRIYNRLWSRADELIKRHQPCQWHRDPEGHMQCLGSKAGFVPPDSACCISCKHHTPEKGCQADRPLSCRTWLCGHHTRDLELERKLRQIRERAWRLWLSGIRQQKPEVMRQAVEWWNDQMRRGGRPHSSKVT